MNILPKHHIFDCSSMNYNKRRIVYLSQAFTSIVYFSQAFTSIVYFSQAFTSMAKTFQDQRDFVCH